jgi:hypothetical protein
VFILRSKYKAVGTAALDKILKYKLGEQNTSVDVRLGGGRDLTRSRPKLGLNMGLVDVYVALTMYL